MSAAAASTKRCIRSSQMLFRDDSMRPIERISFAPPGGRIKESGVAHKALKRKLAIAGKVLAANGQGDFTRGHISVRLPGKKPLFLMKPHSVGLDEITAKNILTIDMTGKVVAGTARRHSEVFIHSEIYKARPDVGCVIHSHPPYSVALSGSTRPIKALSQGGALFRGEVGLYGDTINLIRTPEMGAGV